MTSGKLQQVMSSSWLETYRRKNEQALQADDRDIRLKESFCNASQSVYV